MESNSSRANLCTLHSQFMGHVQAVTASESKALEAWNSSFLSAPVDQSIGVSCLYPDNVSGAGVGVTDLQSRFADGEVSTLLCFGGNAPSHGFKQGYQNVFSSESKTCLGVTGALDLSADGICAQCKVGLQCEDAAFHTFLPPSAQLDRLDVPVSETCQKRLVMVDQTGSNRKMICFPALGHDCPSFLQCSAISHRDYVEQLQITSVTALDQWKETTADLNRGIIKEESGFSCSRNDWQSGFGKFAGMKCERPQSVIFIGGEVPTQLSYAPVEVEALGAGSGNDVSLDFQSFSHEDTDDLEALLSSDDELSSTGHSPSDVSPSNSPMLSNGYCMDDSSLNSGKKRKRDVINYCSDGDAESSTATSTFVQLDYLKDSGADIFPAVSGRESATFKQCRHTGSCEEVTAFAVRFPNETSSRNESAKHRAVYKKAPPEKKRPAKRARKKKIRQTFQMLRHIIPGGDCMNTAFVLGEAIQYVKSLQVKVQRLEAKKLL